MRRPWHIWIIFAACLALVAVAVGMISATLLRLDATESEARQRAALEEAVRLALWRTHSALAPLITRESALPYFAYTSFYPAERAYTRMFNSIGYGDVLIPSPLLTIDSPYVLVHFQIGPDGALTSPQVPTGEVRVIAEDGYTSEARIRDYAEKLDALRGQLDREELIARLPLEVTTRGPPTVATLGQTGGMVQQQMAEPQQRAVKSKTAQAELNQREQQARGRAQQQMLDPTLQWASNEFLTAADVTVGSLSALWCGQSLVLARRVQVNGREYVQGCALDWEAVHAWLQREVRELLPEAELEPAARASAVGDNRLLPTLPVRLVPGDFPSLVEEGLLPVEALLALTWTGLVIAAAAVTVLLMGTLALSERRAAFVSAITHELRTPLTTFRMYTEMLAEGMLTDGAKRQRYLETLRIEAERLSHLVENVLSYARLERGRARNAAEPIQIDDLLDRVGERLGRRAEQGGMRVVIDIAPEHRRLSVRVDASATEQILLNLVDNACKYAAGTGDGAIRVSTRVDQAGVVLSVSDDGPGIAPSERKRIFRAFHKSARQAAHSAPGVGLGLSLSRRMARDMGGDLRLVSDGAPGARFELILPAAR